MRPCFFIFFLLSLKILILINHVEKIFILLVMQIKNQKATQQKLKVHVADLDIMAFNFEGFLI